MARTKNKRNLNFKPIYKEFGPINIDPHGNTYLLHEEIEAIYLMDVLEMYQEEAAISMEVSRPTFTRIIKNARVKIANALISGNTINIQNTKENSILAFCSNDENKFDEISIHMKYILFFFLFSNSVEFIGKINNPLYQTDKKPAIVLPEVFLENKVNTFISDKIGEGLKNSLTSKGIQSIKRKNLKKEDLLLLH